MMQVVNFCITFQHNRRHIIIIEKPPEIVTIMFLHGTIEFLLKIEYSANVGLRIDVPCNVFGVWLGDQYPTNVYFVIMTEYFKLKIAGAHETNVERLAILHTGFAAFNAIAFVIPDLVKVGIMENMDLRWSHVSKGR